ncbi:hypothetical protein V8C35DRAFT_309044 [Trichoderma chlorosporum]
MNRLGFRCGNTCMHPPLVVRRITLDVMYYVHTCLGSYTHLVIHVMCMLFRCFCSFACSVVNNKPANGSSICVFILFVGCFHFHPFSSNLSTCPL